MSDHRSRQAAEDRSSVETGDPVTTAARGQHVLILGGGYVGLYTALQLQKKLRRGEARITLVDPRSYMTYQPFLPEAAAGSLEPRHVVVSLRRELRGVEVITGRVSRVDHERRTATVLRDAGAPMTLHYDQVVVAVGSIARTLPIPGLTDIGIGFKHVEEAIALRNHVLDRLDVAANLDDPELRARALTFVFVGGGYAGIEALAELEDMARAAVSSTTVWPLRTCASSSSRHQDGSSLRSVRIWVGTPSNSSVSAGSTSGSRPASSRAPTATSSCPTAQPCVPTRSSGRPACGRVPSWPTPISPSMTGDGSVALPTFASKARTESSRAPGGPVIAPLCRTSHPCAAICAHRAPNTPSGRHVGWATTSCPYCVARSRRSTSTATWALLHRWACTRALRRSTA